MRLIEIKQKGPLSFYSNRPLIALIDIKPYFGPPSFYSNRPLMMRLTDRKLIGPPSFFVFYVSNNNTYLAGRTLGSSPMK